MVEDIWSLKDEIINIINECFSSDFLDAIFSELEQRDLNLLIELWNEMKEMLPIKTKNYVINQYELK